MTATKRRVAWAAPLLALLALLPASASAQLLLTPTSTSGSLPSLPETRVRGSDQNLVGFASPEGELSRGRHQAWGDSWSGIASDYAFAPKSTGRLQPGLPEHRAQRWADYQARNGKLTYEQWSRVYEQNITRATRANEAVDAYHRSLGWGRRELTVDVEGVLRRLDIGDDLTFRAREVKTGYQSLTQENHWEILRDQILREKGWDLRWHFDGYATPKLRKALDQAGIPYTGGTR